MLFIHSPDHPKTPSEFLLHSFLLHLSKRCTEYKSFSCWMWWKNTLVCNVTSIFSLCFPGVERRAAPFDLAKIKRVRTSLLSPLPLLRPPLLLLLPFSDEGEIKQTLDKKTLTFIGNTELWDAFLWQEDVLTEQSCSRTLRYDKRYLNHLLRILKQSSIYSWVDVCREIALLAVSPVCTFCVSYSNQNILLHAWKVEHVNRWKHGWHMGTTAAAAHRSLK